VLVGPAIMSVMQATAALERPMWREHAAAYLAGAAAAASVVSIFASEVFLILGALALLAGRREWRWPPITLPLACWIGWTLLSVAVSGELRSGFPQVKKIFWYLMLFAVYSAIRTMPQVRAIALAWVAGAALSAIWGLEQFARKYTAAQGAHQDFYTFYVGRRITGFMDHWMTFSGHMMMALMVAGALLLFAHDRKRLPWLLGACAFIGAALLAAFTRSVWPGAAVGLLYLMWFRRKWLVAIVPAIAGIVLLANPFQIRERVISIVQPHEGQVDSNEHRAVLRRVGWEMIKAHPLFGVGPEQVKPQFMNYLPADAPHPVPKEWYYDHLHNIYIHFAAERGLPALAALLWMIGKALTDFLRALRNLNRESEARWMLHAAVAVILAIMVAGYGEVNLGDSEVLAMFLAVLACGYTAVDRVRCAKPVLVP
jgi:O-antigen ligase